MKLSLLSAALLAFFPAVAPAITINIFSDVLKTTDINTPMPTSGIVLLTAATTGTFNGPSGTSFVTGDEVILGLWDLSAVGLDGAFADTTGDLSFSGLWDEGDALRLYWYPTPDHWQLGAVRRHPLRLLLGPSRTGWQRSLGHHGRVHQSLA